MPSELIGEEWEFILIEDDDVINAFALPSAKVGVYTGLFKIAKSDADLAVVIGHEMGHVVAKHGGERMSQQMVALGGSILLSQATKGDSREDRERLFRIYGLGSTIGVLLPYSRMHENEADRLGLIYMAQAGYDPRVAISFWERMEKENHFICRVDFNTPFRQKSNNGIAPSWRKCYIIMQNKVILSFLPKNI